MGYAPSFVQAVEPLAPEAGDDLSLVSCGAAPSEAARLAALQRYDVLDTPSEEAFERITRLSKKIFDVPMVLVSLIDGHRQWFKSRIGVAITESPRDSAFCNVTLQRGAPLIVHDATIDPAFANNPLVLGEPRIRFYAGAPLRTPDGHVLGALCLMDRKPRAFDADQVSMLADLAQIVMDELELRQLADTDNLTGALSRRAFRDAAARALSLAERRGHELALIAVDLDHFKRVNDAHGHAVGDAVLAGSVAACLAQLRASDVIGRLGGEEFAILLPNTGPTGALDVAERLRAAISSEVYEAGGTTFQVSASFGVATRTEAASDIDALLSAADAALYVAKFQGRDRCVVAAGPSRHPTDAGIGRRVFKGGKILFNRRMASRDCTVRRLSDSSARLDVSSAEGLPDSFELSIDADDVVRRCRIVAASDRRIEVEFVSKEPRGMPGMD